MNGSHRWFRRVWQRKYDWKCLPEPPFSNTSIPKFNPAPTKMYDDFEFVHIEETC